jgi:hypothetical protein
MDSRRVRLCTKTHIWGKYFGLLSVALACSWSLDLWLAAVLPYGIIRPGVKHGFRSDELDKARDTEPVV